MKKLSRGELRIIAGRWRGRRLQFPDANDLRPTTDRVRETVFNWLQSDIVGSQCLDLFAGSGALGFEAASRGSGNVLMVEKNKETVAGIRDNVKMLNADQVRVFCDDAVDFLVDGKNSKNHLSDRLFDIVFMDPPYSSNLLIKCCELLEQGHWLADRAKIYVEYDINSSLGKMPAGWRCLKTKKAGQVGYGLYQKINL